MNFNAEHQSTSQQFNKFYEALGNPTVSGNMFAPSLNNIPWNVSMMPWMSNQNNSLVEFTGAATANSLVEFTGATTANLKPQAVPKAGLHAKRKSDLELNIPAKHLITEEKMVAHMSGLHISNNYVSHSNSTAADLENSLPSTSSFNSSSMDTHITMTQRELEQKLKNAHSITVCEEIKKLSNDPIIPKILMDRLEKPCTALVVWQPPKNLNSVFNNMIQENNQWKSFYAYHNRNNSYTNKSNSDQASTDGDAEDEVDNLLEVEEILDNNNSSNVDLNSCMDLDM